MLHFVIQQFQRQYNHICTCMTNVKDQMLIVKKKQMIKYLHVFNKGYSNINQYVSALYLMVNQCCKKDV